jgi:acetyl-CoA carboxylase biotin carboxyl carrier protein
MPKQEQPQLVVESLKALGDFLVSIGVVFVNPQVTLHVEGGSVRVEIKPEKKSQYTSKASDETVSKPDPEPDVKKIEKKVIAAHFEKMEEEDHKSHAERLESLGFKIIKNIMVGTYYQASSPDAKPFITVGDSVEKGTVVCVIEAMKLMNEIVSEVEGVVVKIIKDNSQPSEFGEVLFIIQ